MFCNSKHLIIGRTTHIQCRRIHLMPLHKCLYYLTTVATLNDKTNEFFNAVCRAVCCAARMLPPVATPPVLRLLMNGWLIY